MNFVIQNRKKNLIVILCYLNWLFNAHIHSPWASNQPQTQKRTTVRGDAGLGRADGERTGSDRLDDSVHRKEEE